MVGTWSLDQTLLWTPGTNATTGEHVDLSDLGLVGAQLDLVQAVKATGKPTVVVLVSGKPVAEPWIQASACDLMSPLGAAALNSSQMQTLSSSNSTLVSWVASRWRRSCSAMSTHQVRDFGGADCGIASLMNPAPRKAVRLLPS